MAIEGEFTPGLVGSLSEKWGIPINLMFMGSPGRNLGHTIADLAGMHLII